MPGRTRMEGPGSRSDDRVRPQVVTGQCRLCGIQFLRVPQPFCKVAHHLAASKNVPTTGTTHSQPRHTLPFDDSSSTPAACATRCASWRVLSTCVWLMPPPDRPFRASCRDRSRRARRASPLLPQRDSRPNTALYGISCSRPKSAVPAAAFSFRFSHRTSKRPSRPRGGDGGRSRSELYW
jgi:hypothetical protein